MFVIMVNVLPKSIRSSYSGMYADDKIIWNQKKILVELKREIEDDVTAALKWYEK